LDNPGGKACFDLSLTQSRLSLRIVLSVGDSQLQAYTCCYSLIHLYSLCKRGKKCHARKLCWLLFFPSSEFVISNLQPHESATFEATAVSRAIKKHGGVEREKQTGERERGDVTIFFPFKT